MAKRIAIFSGLVLAALLAGLLGARLIGGPFISRAPQDSAPVTERYALGRDVYRQQDYAVGTRYSPYRPGEKRIASPTVSGARALEPYQAARPDHRIAYDSQDGNFMDATGLPEGNYAMIDPARRPAAKSVSTAPKPNGPENLVPGDYIRTERPTCPAAVATPAAGSAKREAIDPIGDTERRIIDIAGEQAARRNAGPASAGESGSEASGPIRN